MPLTDFQKLLLADLARGAADQRYLAGGTALHFTPDSVRYSNDLDFFHDSAERVAVAFRTDNAVLQEAGYGLSLVFSQPGFIRALVSRDANETQVDWAHDSAWRFMPLVSDEMGGLLLHKVDLAVNKVLALAGRDEARDLVDVLFADSRILSLGPLVWAAVGKDPGFSPISLLEQLRRSGRYRPEDIARLNLAEPFDLVEGKQRWLAALAEADVFVGSRPPEEIGCLYWSDRHDRFDVPVADIELAAQGLIPHFGRPGGVLPRPSGQILAD